MRHRQNTQNLSRFSSYYKATIRSLARAVLLHQRIITTSLRAKLAKRLVDKLITLGKDVDSLAARRRANAVLNDHALVKRLFSQIAPTFSENNGGYTRIIPYKRRRGDNAELVVLELSKQTEIVRPAPESKKAAAKTAQERPKAAPKEEAASKPEHKEIAPPEKEKHKKETKRPSKQNWGGFGKFFKPERDSL